MSKLAREISRTFWKARNEKGVKEPAVYPLLVEFLDKEFSNRMVVEKNRPLLLRITAALDNQSQNHLKPYLGYSGSDADIVLYPEQTPFGIEKENEILRKYGQYRKFSIIYPSVIIQVITKTQTGKLHQENMKAQAWRSMFPRTLIVLIGGQWKDKPDRRFERDMTYFDFVLQGFENPSRCKKGLESLITVIDSHLKTKWS